MYDLQAPWRTMRFAAFDLETTGTNTREDRIIEIGLVVFEGGEVVDRWSQLVHPERELPRIITDVTGIKPEELEGQPTFVEVVDQLLERIGPQPLLAYNHEFDTSVLTAELERVGRPTELPPCLDPFPFCWEALREKKHTTNAQLGTVSAFLGIPLDAAHRADHDAEAAGRVMLALDRYMELPEGLSDLLGLQRVLMQSLNEKFNRRRRMQGVESRAVLGTGEVVIELGPAYVFGDEVDPIRALMSRIPDVRDMAGRSEG